MEWSNAFGNKNILLSEEKEEVGNRCSLSEVRGIDQKEVDIDKKRALCCLEASRCAASYRFSSATTLAQLANLSDHRCVRATVRPSPLSRRKKCVRPRECDRIVRLACGRSEDVPGFKEINVAAREEQISEARFSGPLVFR